MRFEHISIKHQIDGVSPIGTCISSASKIKHWFIMMSKDFSCTLKAFNDLRSVPSQRMNKLTIVGISIAHRIPTNDTQFLKFLGITNRLSFIILWKYWSVQKYLIDQHTISTFGKSSNDVGRSGIYTKINLLLLYFFPNFFSNLWIILKILCWSSF